MSIVHDGFVFNGLAGTFEEGPARLPLQVLTSPGAYGESHLLGPIQGRELRCRYTLYGLGSDAAVQAILRQMAQYSGRLTGTLIRDGAAARQYPNCTFVGFQPEGPSFYSAGGTIGWGQKGYLHWIQRQV